MEHGALRSLLACLLLAFTHNWGWRLHESIQRRTDCRASRRISSSPQGGKLTSYDTEQVGKDDAEREPRARPMIGWLAANCDSRSLNRCSLLPPFSFPQTCWRSIVQPRSGHWWPGG